MRLLAADSVFVRMLVCIVVGCVRQRSVGQRRDNCPLLVFATTALLLISSLVFCFPLYLKGITAPVTRMFAVKSCGL